MQIFSYFMLATMLLMYSKYETKMCLFVFILFSVYILWILFDFVYVFYVFYVFGSLNQILTWCITLFCKRAKCAFFTCRTTCITLLNPDTVNLIPSSLPCKSNNWKLQINCVFTFLCKALSMNLKCSLIDRKSSAEYFKVQILNILLIQTCYTLYMQKRLIPVSLPALGICLLLALVTTNVPIYTSFFKCLESKNVLSCLGSCIYYAHVLLADFTILLYTKRHFRLPTNQLDECFLTGAHQRVANKFPSCFSGTQPFVISTHVYSSYNG